MNPIPDLNLLSGLGLLFLALTLPGSLYLALLTLAGSLPARRDAARPLPGRLAIVVPAHDEASGIGRTVANLLDVSRQDGHCEVVVVADNCSDDTAERAHQAGARVLERLDAERRGKGYALDFAFTSLLAEDYVAFVVVDADSVVAEGFLDAIRRKFGAGAEALQTRYTMLNGDESPRTGLAEIALAAYNILRLRGRDRLGLSVGILGNGFALRSELLRRVPYTADSVVEDLEYQIYLIAAGRRVQFVDVTAVGGEIPTGQKGRDIQRARWEGGRLRMLIEQGPKLAGQVLRGRLRLLEPLADLLLLPLAYHVMLLLLALLLLALGGWAAAALLALSGLGLVGLHLVAAVAVGRLPWSRLWLLARIPFYLAWKLRMILPILASARRDSAWVRTDRTGS